MRASKKGRPSSSGKTLPQRSAGQWAPAVCLALAAVTFAVFGRTLRHEFIDFDDNDYVYDNPVVARGLTFKGVVWAFTRVHAANWHPLTWISHELDVQLYGLHPGGHHLTNVLLHVATVIVLFLVLRRLTGALGRSAFVAAVFAIHPLRVESVAWVAERKDVLSGLFFMLTLAAYVRYARRPWSAARYGLVMLLFAMGLMCKPMLVTLPVVLLLLDYWPLHRVESARRLVMEKLPLLALSATSAAITLLAQRGAIHSGLTFSWPLRLGNALVACMVYLGQMVYPAGLAVFYPFPVSGIPPWELALDATLLGGLSAVAFYRRRSQPWLWVGWLWYLVMLLPVVGLIQQGAQAHADRYTYLPQIGIYVAVTWLVTEWSARWKYRRVVLGGLTVAVMSALMFCAGVQTSYWHDSQTLWEHALACTSGNYLAHNYLGISLFRKSEVEEAIQQYRLALAIKPDFAEAHYNLGQALARQGEEEAAIAQFRQALQSNPDDVDALINLGVALAQSGQLEESVAQLQKAVTVSPDNAQAHNNLGAALANVGKVEEAIVQCRQAVAISPDYVQARNNLAADLTQNGNLEEAIAQFRGSLAINPDQISVQNNLAWLLATASNPSLRNGPEAVALATQASQLTGGANPVILRTLAAAYTEAGRFVDAIATARRALALALEQKNDALVGTLQQQIKLYEAGAPSSKPK